MRGEDASPTTSYEMSKSAGKFRKRYVDQTKDKSIQTCLFRVPRHSSDECKVLGYFDSKYSKIRPTKNRGHENATEKKSKMEQ